MPREAKCDSDLRPFDGMTQPEYRWTAAACRARANESRQGLAHEPL